MPLIDFLRYWYLAQTCPQAESCRNRTCSITDTLIRATREIPPWPNRGGDHHISPSIEELVQCALIGCLLLAGLTR